MKSSTFNLIKACVGSGVLSLSSGVAAFGDVPAAILPASILMSTLGVLSAYSFYIIGKMCSQTNSLTISEAWGKSVGEDSTWAISLACFLTPLGAALSYSIILADVFKALSATVGINLPRPVSILSMSTFVLYPLCSLQSLASLAPFSILGVVGILVTAVFMAVRAFGGAYGVGGAMAATLAPAFTPSFGNIGVNLVQPSSLILVSMAATAYLSHFNAPDFYNQLKSPSPRRFKILTGMGFFATAVLSILMMSFGFLTFGSASSGIILNNYSTLDVGATVCRLLMGIAIIGTYPFVFSGMRSAFFQLIKKGKTVTSKETKTATQLMLAGVTGLALVLKNAGFIVSFNGALMGSAIIYVFPPLMYLKSTGKKIKEGAMKVTKKVKLERMFNRLLIALGVTFAVCGGAVTVMDSFFPHLL
ncbi:hypothetical protein TrCOL_g11585 [Triparma columacea]|uniref:Amino acid transporter transmembrane domain-containing protein n=1 Tax=Triparma columacea TaxID=722753 RepID=A0A9W7GEN6_9STRA|nr:hypothetical protein TrCOL_g11585 [Triparma columacea]